MSCPDSLTLASAERPDAPGRESILAHAAGCAACRATLAELAALGLEPEEALGAGALDALRRTLAEHRSRWCGFAIPAAAALLLAALLLPRLRQDVLPPSSPPAPEAPAPLPRFTETETVLGRASALTLKPGTRASVQGNAVTLIEGALWLENPGEPVTLRAGDALVEVEAGVILLETFPAAWSWLPEALAGETQGRLVVLSGSARLRLAKDAVHVSAGLEVLLSAGVPRPAGPITWRGDRGWYGQPELPRRLAEGEHALASSVPGASYVWEVLFRRLTPTASASICLAAGEQGWQVPLGATWQGEQPIRVRVELRAGWVKVTAGTQELMRRPLRELGWIGLDAGKPFCGLKVWGGGVEVLESRWKEIP